MGGSTPEGEVQVPDVSGRSLKEAVRIISDAGFEVAAIKTRAGQKDQETALRTEPRAGILAKQGAPVILTISAGPNHVWSGTQSTSASASASAGATNRKSRGTLVSGDYSELQRYRPTADRAFGFERSPEREPQN